MEALRLDGQIFAEWQHSAQESASQKAKAVKSKNRLQVRSARSAMRAHRPGIHFGTVASGSLVVASKRKQRELLLLHGRIIGTETEGASVLHATFRRELPTAAIVIKGISDSADKNKGLVDALGYWRELAKENPARLVIKMIQCGRITPLQTDQFDLDPTRGSIDDARQMIPDVSAPRCLPFILQNDEK
ncbi:hypothetical protein L0222_19110 [bacterium]|nr:hypothetical protein [bacterium]MCI0605724.1 hypothetical protein [bacterium]